MLSDFEFEALISKYIKNRITEHYFLEQLGKNKIINLSSPIVMYILNNYEKFENNIKTILSYPQHKLNINLYNILSDELKLLYIININLKTTFPDLYNFETLNRIIGQEDNIDIINCIKDILNNLESNYKVHILCMGIHCRVSIIKEYIIDGLKKDIFTPNNILQIIRLRSLNFENYKKFFKYLFETNQHKKINLYSFYSKINETNIITCLTDDQIEKIINKKNNIYIAPFISNDLFCKYFLKEFNNLDLINLIYILYKTSKINRINLLFRTNYLDNNLDFSALIKDIDFSIFMAKYGISINDEFKNNYILDLLDLPNNVIDNKFSTPILNYLPDVIISSSYQANNTINTNAEIYDHISTKQ